MYTKMFTHLHCHSYFSFNAGTIPATELPVLAKNAGLNALALTDTNNMSGAIEFYFAARKAGIKPILGVELKTRRERAVLLAKNNAGYKEMCETLTSVLAGIPQTKPKLTLEDAEEAKKLHMNYRTRISDPRHDNCYRIPIFWSYPRTSMTLSSSKMILEVSTFASFA